MTGEAKTVRQKLEELPETFGTPELARALGFGRHTIRRMAEAGEFSPGAYRRPGGRWRITRAGALAWYERVTPRVRRRQA